MTPLLPTNWPALYRTDIPGVMGPHLGSQMESVQKGSTNSKLVDENYTKKDAFWKTVLRLFRRYLKSEANQQLATSKSVNIPVRDQSAALCDLFEIPATLRADPRTSMALLVMVNSHRITRRKQLVPEIREFLGLHIEEVLSNYCRVFVDNNSQ